MVSHLYPIDNSIGWRKNETCPIVTPGVSCFYPKSQFKNGTCLKAILLISKSHLPKLLSVP